MYDNAKRRDEKDEDLLAAVSCTGVQPGVALPAFINVTQGFLVMIKMGQQCYLIGEGICADLQIILSQLYFCASSLREGSITPPRRRSTCKARIRKNIQATEIREA